MKFQFIKPTLVKRYVHKRGKRVSNIFLHGLDNLIQNKLDAAIALHDGGRKTLDRDTAVVVNLFFMGGTHGKK